MRVRLMVRFTVKDCFIVRDRVRVRVWLEFGLDGG